MTGGEAIPNNLLRRFLEVAEEIRDLVDPARHVVIRPTAVAAVAGIPTPHCTGIQATDGVVLPEDAQVLPIPAKTLTRLRRAATALVTYMAYDAVPHEVKDWLRELAYDVTVSPSHELLTHVITYLSQHSPF